MVLLHLNINSADKEAVEPVLAELEELEKRIASRFARLEAKKAALAYIKGLSLFHHSKQKKIINGQIR